MKKHLCVIAATLFFSACAGPMVFEKAGASEQDHQRDRTDCLVKAGQAGYNGGGIIANNQRMEFIQQCMEGQGWKRTN